MEPMEIEYYLPEWKVSTAPFNNEENVVIDDISRIHCIRNYPFNINIVFLSRTSESYIFIFSLINSESYNQPIVRCEKHKKSDRLTKLCHKPYPLIIHEDLSPEYSYRYAENGSVAVILPPNRQVHEIPVALKCSTKCTKKSMSLMTYILNAGLKVPTKILSINVYDNQKEFEANLKNILKEREMTGNFPKLQSISEKVIK